MNKKQNKASNEEKLPFNGIPELIKASEILQRIHYRYENLKKLRKITNKNKSDFADDIYSVLEVVGEMTDPLFEMRDKMEYKYFSTMENKKEAKRLFLKEYEALHEPYDDVKTMGWKLYYRVMGLKETEK